MAVSRLSPGVGSDIGGKLIAIHQALDRVGVAHAFGGTIALAYAVVDPRSVIDIDTIAIDVNIAVGVDQAGRVVAALPDGVTARNNVVDVICRDGQDRLRWGGVAIDLFFPKHRFHATVLSRAGRQPFRNVTIPVVTASDLTIFKALCNRKRDWSDIEAMIRAGAVDEPEALRWVADIAGTDHPCFLRLSHMLGSARPEPGGPPQADMPAWTPVAPAART